MDYLSLGLGILIGAVIAGIGVYAFFARKTGGDGELEVVRLKTQLEEQQKHAAELQERMNETFAKLSQDALDKNSDRFLQHAETKFAPFKDLLNKAQSSVADLESKRVQAYSKLESASKQIIEETSKLENILRRPDHRGKWGEFKLRTTVEHAQMQKYVDFNEQVTIGDEQTYRPDMVIKLPSNGRIVVDSKLPFDHYNKAVEDKKNSDTHLDNHVKLLEKHIHELSSKKYWEHIEGSPDFVVMFVGIESALVAALEQKPELLEAAMKKNVLITSPSTLIALLQASAFGWAQYKMVENVGDIAKAGKELYERLENFRGHLATLGNRLKQATGSYNDAVGSFTTRIGPSAKRLSKFQSSGEGTELEPIDPVDIEPRSLE